MFPDAEHSVRIHDLLEIDAEQLVCFQMTAPEWLKEDLRKSPYAVVRRGTVTEQKIPIGFRGPERNQRWAADCHPKLVRRIITPTQLLTSTILTSHESFVPALHTLHLLKLRWMDLHHLWGPGGSVGFELATGRQVVKPESDLDIVIFAEGRMTVAEAESLWTRAMDLPAAVDIRVETPVCGFSLGEFVNQSPSPILLRTSNGFMFGRDPWSNEVEIIETELCGERGLRI